MTGFLKAKKTSGTWATYMKHPPQPTATEIKLDPKECVFRIRSGKFLSFTISSRGIEASLDKVQVVLDMRFPRNVKEMQQLTGCVIVLRRFMSKYIGKC